MKFPRWVVILELLLLLFIRPIYHTFCIELESLAFISILIVAGFTDAAIFFFSQDYSTGFPLERWFVLM